MDTSLPSLPETTTSRSSSPRSKFFIFGLSVLLLISLIGNGWLWLEKQTVSSDVQNEPSIASSPTPQFHAQQLFESPEEDRIGTDPKSEVIPRLFKIFQQENVKMDPFPCIYQDVCRAEVHQDDQFFWALDSVRLNLYLQTNDEAAQYYDRIASIFKKNSYNILPETIDKVEVDGTRSRRTDMTHPEKEIECNAVLRIIESQSGPQGRTELGYPVIQLSCVNLDQRNRDYISLQKALFTDLALSADADLFVKSFTDNYALISTAGTCMIVKKTNGVWTTLDSSGCSDPSWNARGGSLSTILNRDYGIPLKEAEVLYF